MRMLKKCAALCLALGLMLGCLGASAQELGGMAYELYKLNYEEDVSFINNNTGRHMLPMLLSESVDEDDGSLRFAIIGDTLTLEGKTDPMRVYIEVLSLKLTTPSADLQPGTILYSDFETSAYHSYALLMAMDASATALERYALVTRVNEGLKQALEGGSRGVVMQVGAYELTVERDELSSTMTFVNSSLVASPTVVDAPADEGGDDAAPTDAPSGDEGEDSSNAG